MLVSLISYTILRIDADGGELNFSTTFIADGLGIYACIYYIPPSFSRTSSNQSLMSSGTPMTENGSPQPKNQIYITAPVDAKDKHVTKHDIAEGMAAVLINMSPKMIFQKVSLFLAIILIVENNNFRCACGTFRGCCWGTCYPGCKCPGMS